MIKTKSSYGVILIEDPEGLNDLNKIAYYKKYLRLMLDKPKDVYDIMLKINSNLAFKRWDTLSNESLNNLEATLDN